MRYTVCQTCLKSGDDVTPMSAKDIERYHRLFNEVTKQMEMYICVFCSSLLYKLEKFIEQCQKAYVYLNEEINETKRPLLNYNNISISPIKTYYVGPECDQVLDLDLKTEDSVFDCNEAYVTEDEDEVPLVLFCGGNGDHAELEEVKKENLEVNTENEISKTQKNMKRKEIMKGGKKKGKKKILREGFTSRMVQETSEYTVIKLTKDQVLEEMKERSKSERYLRAPYKCDKCVKGFNFEDVLESHLEKHSPKNGPLRCELCSQYCPSAVSLRGHMKSHSTRYRCKLCGYIRLSRQHVLEHYTIAHSDAPAAYRCSQCAFTTNKRTVMQRHVRAHARTEPHACDKCGKLYKSLDSLRVHTMRHDNIKRFQCEQCSLSFVYPTLLHKHVRSVHTHRDCYCVECDIKFKSMFSRIGFALMTYRDIGYIVYLVEPESRCPERKSEIDNIVE
ncbi:zinc finger protein 2-like [Battus philenor]|uniref:zinc finger protein 2-like n=1 Tax=Battus philenor TaxID=42288 RepID=UPI0035CEA9FC